MGLFTSVDGEVRVVAAPFCTLSLDPPVKEVRKGDLNSVAFFKLNIAWQPGYTRPIYLLIAGFSEGLFYLDEGGTLMVPDKDYALVPNGTPFVMLQMDMAGMDVINIPFSIGAYEDEPLPVEDLPF